MNSVISDEETKLFVQEDVKERIRCLPGRNGSNLNKIDQTFRLRI